MTADAMIGDRGRSLAARLDGYLTKPIRLAALEAALDQWLVGNSVRDPVSVGGESSPASGTPDDSEVLDAATMAGLRRLGSTSGGLGHLVQALIEDTTARLEALRRGIRHLDAELVAVTCPSQRQPGGGSTI